MFWPDRQSNEFYGDGRLLAVWLLLISWANFKDGKTKLKRQKILLKRGQLVTSEREIAKQLGFSKTSVRRCLSYFEENEKIRPQAGPHGTIITILNYDKYQPQEGLTGPLNSPHPDHTRTNIEERNKGNNNIKTSLPSFPSPQSEAGGQDEIFLSESEATLIRHAELKLDRVFSDDETASFATYWRARPKFTLERLMANIDWIAEHPLARHETKYPLSRIFYESEMRGNYEKFRTYVINLAATQKRMGANNEDVVEYICHQNPAINRPLLSKFIERQLDDMPSQ